MPTFIGIGHWSFWALVVLRIGRFGNALIVLGTVDGLGVERAMPDDAAEYYSDNDEPAGSAIAAAAVAHPPAKRTRHSYAKQRHEADLGAGGRPVLVFIISDLRGFWSNKLNRRRLQPTWESCGLPGVIDTTAPPCTQRIVGIAVMNEWSWRDTPVVDIKAFDGGARLMVV